MRSHDSSEDEPRRRAVIRIEGTSPPDPSAAAERHPTPATLPWLGPPAELESVVPVSQFLHQNSSVSLAITDVHAFSTGCEIHIKAVLHRERRSSEEWNLFIDSFHPKGHPETPVVGALDIALTLGDGRRASTLSGYGSSVQPDSDQFVLHYTSSHGSWISHEDWTVEAGLWLWPLPEPGTLFISAEWPNANVSSEQLLLDANAIHVAGRRAQSM
ncbi:hypothetical protein M2251_000046 [Rhodococcus erythropolis]|nr:hypothetical protein [Rhodococcus erythropolis]